MYKNSSVYGLAFDDTGAILVVICSMYKVLSR